MVLAGAAALATLLSTCQSGGVVASEPGNGSRPAASPRAQNGPERGAAAPAGQALRWDFEDGTSRGWAGMNSEAGVSDQRAHGGSARSLRIAAGQWGATFTLESAQLASVRALSFWIWCDLEGGKDAAWPQLWVDGANTNLWIGPGEGGRLQCGQWVPVRIDLDRYPRPRSVAIQVWAVRQIFVDDVAAELVAADEPPGGSGGAAASEPRRAAAQAAHGTQALRWDFEDGKTGGWTGMNSEARVSDARGHGGSARSLHVAPGQWGANFKLESPELARVQSLRLRIWCDVASGKPAAWPQLHVNGANTNLWIGPGEGGRLECGKWVPLEVDLARYPRRQSVAVQVWDVRQVFVDDVVAEIGAAYEPKTIPARVTVDTGKVLHEVGAHAHGTNFVALWNDTGDSPGTVRAFSRLGLGLVRFPGGVPAQWYDWKNPLASGWTQITPERAWKLARAGGARMVFQTNAATNEQGFNASAAHQAGWVAAAREAGIDVAFWEIGNEPEMDAPKQLRNDQAAVYGWYNKVFGEQARAIKAVDPQARVLGPASTNSWFWWHEGNLAKFLAAHGNRRGSGLVDAVSLHWYPEGGKGPWEAKRGAAQDWADAMTFIRGVIAEHDTRALPVYVTEWNWGGGTDDLSARKLSNALGCADVAGMFLRSGVAGHTHFCLQRIDRNWGILAMAQDSRPQNHPSPTYFGLALAARLSGRMLDVASDADARNVLSAYAAQGADGAVRVLLVNKSPDKVEATVSLAGPGAARTRSEVLVETLEGASGDIEDEEVVFNGVRSPDPARDELPKPRAEPAPARSRVLSPYSLTLLTFAR